MLDEEQLELLSAFVEESNELLDESEPLLIELETLANESGEVDSEVINTIFRLFHSLKGGAGFLDLGTVGKVTHVAETLLDLFRKGKGSISSEHIDLLTKTCDFLRQMLTNIETEFSDDGFEEEAKAIIKDLRVQISGITGESEEPPASTVTKQPDPDLPREEEAKSEAVQEASDEMKLVINEEMIKQFTAESEDLLAETEEAFLALRLA